MKNVIMIFTAFFFFSSVSLQGIVYTISNPNDGISAFPGPYGQVTIAPLTNSNIAHITFETFSNIGQGLIFLMGAAQAFDLNVSEGATVSNVVLTQLAGFSGAQYAPPPNPTVQNADGFGSFNLANDLVDGFPSSISKVTFDITKLSGTWLDDASVLTLNNQGFLAAMHVFVWNGSFINPQVFTGFASNGGGITVPEPSTWMLLGSVLGLGLLFSTTRKRKPIHF